MAVWTRGPFYTSATPGGVYFAQCLLWISPTATVAAVTGTPRQARRPAARERASILLLFASEALALTLIGVILAVPAWLTGMALFATSTRWDSRDRTLGFLALATSLPAAIVVVMVLTGGGERRAWVPVLVLGASAAYVAFQLVVARRLMRRLND